MAAVTMGKEIRERMPVRGRKRAKWMEFEGRQVRRDDGSGEWSPGASNDVGPPTCTSLAYYGCLFLLASMLYGVEPLQHLALAHAIVAPLPLAC